MVFGIFTVMLAVSPFALFTQPLYWAYIGEDMKVLNEIYQRVSCYDGIKFGEDFSIYYNIGVGFMIASLVFAGLTALMSLINIVGKAAESKRVYGAKVAALFFFLTTLTAVVLIGIDAAQTFAVKEFMQVFESTVGYGLLGSLLASLFALIFSPRRIKEK